MSHRTLLKALKDGVREQINVINKPSLMGLGAKDDKKIINAQKIGISSVQKMIFDVYRYSTAEGINESKWISKAIKDLIAASKAPKLKLLDAIKTAFQDEDEDGDASTFYSNKMKATEDYSEIESAIDELTNLLESADEEGNIILRDRSDFRASWPELNADRKSKAGYREDIDAVVIDPNGTVGEIRDVYGLRIALPEKPVDGEFLNSGVSDINDQHWIRSEKPYGLEKKTEDNFKEYIQDQYDKKHFGAWFYNNGEPTYLTGAHWFLLQWGKTDAEDDGIHGKGFFHYREAHRDIFYFMEAVWADHRSLGMVYVKTRRTGATFCIVAFILHRALGISSANFGMTSKTDDDAKMIFNNMFVTMFANLPSFFKPIRLSDTPKKVLEFREPQRRMTRTNKDQDQDYEALNTEISYRSTTDDAYDQYALKAYIGDEFSKWKKPQNILNHWRMIGRAFTKGGKITGKAYLLSTVENVNGFDDPEDKDAGTGDKYKYLCETSDMSERNANGRTASGLYRLFIPCDDNFEGFIDKFGRAVKNTPDKPIEGVDGNLITLGINEFLQIEADSKKTPEEKYNFWRLNPRYLEEAFRVASDEATFDLNKLSTQFDYNLIHDNGYVRGNFEWVGGITPSDPSEANVEFIPSEKGRFKIAWMPDVQYRNAKVRKGNITKPGNTYAGAIACDPYRTSQTVSRKLSNGAIHGCTAANNPIGPSNKMFLEYCNRPSDIKIFVWDLIKASVFYGMEALIENNVMTAVQYMEEWGFRSYSMNRPDKKPSQLSPSEKQFGGWNATPAVIEDLTNMLGWYINTFVGDDNSMDKMPFNDTINDWIKYIPKNRTRHDMTVSSSLAIFASRKQSNKKNVDNVTVVPKGIVNKYKINGYRSSRL